MSLGSLSRFTRPVLGAHPRLPLVASKYFSHPLVLIDFFQGGGAVEGSCCMALNFERHGVVVVWWHGGMVDGGYIRPRLGV
jgi:hypothetical protein